jgi:hypothetical protein
MISKELLKCFNVLINADTLEINENLKSYRKTREDLKKNQMEILGRKRYNN